MKLRADARWSIAALTAFFLLSLAVITHAAFLVGIDAAVQNYFIQHQSAISFWEVITTFGSAPIIIIVSLLAIVSFWRAQRKHAMVIYSWTLFTGVVLDLALKAIIARPRPDQVFALNSYPSGHTLMAAVVYGTLLVLANRASTKFFLFSLIALIGISRLVIGVHWLSDVVASWLLGFAIITGALALSEQQNLARLLRAKNASPKK